MIKTLIKNQYPPNYDQMTEAFGDLKKYSPVFAYAPHIYNPFGRNLTEDVIHHETVHIFRQGDLPEIWYYKYVNDPAFRLEEEVIAYGSQLLFAKQKGIRGALLDWIKEKLAMELSGEAYGSLCTYGEAEAKIRNFIKYGKQTNE